MSNETLFLLAVIALVVIALPTWSYSKSWGYRPTGVLTVLLVIFLVWALVGGRPLFRSGVGNDLRQTGRDMSATIRHDVQ